MLKIYNIALFLKKKSLFHIKKRFDFRYKTTKIHDSSSGPIKYSTSDAAKWKAIYTTSGENYFDIPKIQPLVIVCSLTAVIIYFCILREENDLDDYLRKMEKLIPLRIEEASLRAEIEQYKRSGLNATSLETRLDRLLEKKALEEK